jgi:cytochrome c biogenesis protein ResB
MWRTATKPRVDVGASFFEHAPQHEAVVVRMSQADTMEAVGGVLRRHRYRVLTAQDESIHIYADRFRWAPFAGLIGHLALVVILAGAIIGGRSPGLRVHAPGRRSTWRIGLTISDRLRSHLPRPPAPRRLRAR